MVRLSGHYEVKEIDHANCAVVEDKVDFNRMKWLKELLELNGYTVKVAENPPATVQDGMAAVITFTVGVTDITFNTSLAIYSRNLRKPGGGLVDREYWDKAA